MALDPTGLVNWAVKDCLDRVSNYLSEANKYWDHCQELEKYLEQIKPIVHGSVEAVARNSQIATTGTAADKWLQDLEPRLLEAETVLKEALEWVRTRNVVHRSLAFPTKKKWADKIRAVTEDMKKVAQHEIPFATHAKVLELENTVTIAFTMLLNRGGKFANGRYLSARMGEAERKMREEAEEALMKVAEEPEKVHEMQRVVGRRITIEMKKIRTALLEEEQKENDKAVLDATVNRLNKTGLLEEEPKENDKAELEASLQRLDTNEIQAEHTQALPGVQQGGLGTQEQDNPVILLDDTKSTRPRIPLRSYSVKEIKVATKNFSTKIGEGGDYAVYSGVLSDGLKVAVKVAKGTDDNFKLRFLRELELMAQCRHENILVTHGYCISTDSKGSKLWRKIVRVKPDLKSQLESASELMMIAELAENGSVHDYMNLKHEALGWANRFGIIVGVAKGLVYLHHDSGLRILHRDIKPSNIFVDNHMCPKIGDFGISISLDLQDDEAMFEHVRGTIGYLDPEFFTGALSLASDVYSFGLTVLFIVSGKAPSGTNLRAWGAALIREGLEEEVLGSRLSTSFLKAQVSRVVHVALLCTQTLPGSRPNMKQVLSMLVGDTGPEPSLSALLQAEEGREDEITSGRLLGEIPAEFPEDYFQTR